MIQPSPKRLPVQGQKIQRCRHYVPQVRLLSKTLLRHLSRTVDLCEKFCTEHADDFQTIENRRPLLPPIRKVLKGLKELRMTLEYLAKNCEDFNHEVSNIRIRSSQAPFAFVLTD